MTRGLLLSVVFFASWAGTSFIMGNAMPFPDVPNVSAKREYFDAHRDRIDTIFIGSSRMVSQVIPAEFDAETAAEGEPTLSFNLGCTGMWPPESVFYLRQILSLRPPRLKWVLIDLMDVDSHLFDGNAGTKRGEYWHDAHDTAMAWRDVLESDQSATWKCAQVWKHGWIFVRRWFSTGRGSDWLEAQTLQFRPAKTPDWIARGGFEPTPKGSMTGEKRQQFMENVAVLKKGMSMGAVRPVLHDAMLEMAAAVRRAGARPVFILAPTINVTENYAGLPSGVTVLEFNNPAEYPELFEPDLHFDALHLNERGAVPYTRILARRFVEWERSSAAER